MEAKAPEKKEEAPAEETAAAAPFFLTGYLIEDLLSQIISRSRPDGRRPARRSFLHPLPS